MSLKFEVPYSQKKIENISQTLLSYSWNYWTQTTIFIVHFLLIFLLAFFCFTTTNNFPSSLNEIVVDVFLLFSLALFVFWATKKTP